MNKHNVEYILVGGFSVILYGYSRTAGDLDFWVNKSTENYARLVKAINEFGMPVFDMTKENFLNHPFCDVSSFGRSPVSIDIMTSVKRLDFKETYRNSKIFEVQGIQIRTFHKNDLIKAKKASNCPKDEEDLNNIGDKKKFLKKIMPLTPLTPRPSFEENPNLAKAADNLRTLLTAIAQKKIPRLQEQKINEIIAGVNNSLGQDPELLKQKKAAQTAIIKLLEQDLQLVPKNHYQLQWLVLGMAAFAIPIGIAFGLALGNLAFLGIGLPVGMGIGIAVGTVKDKQAQEEGRQLDWAAK